MLQGSAVALGAKVEDAKQLINTFFKNIEEFKAERVVGIEAHNADVDNMTEEQKKALWNAIDNAYIAKVATFFYQYQVMWYKLIEIGDAIPEGEKETFQQLISVEVKDARTKLYEGV